MSKRAPASAAAPCMPPEIVVATPKFLPGAAGARALDAADELAPLRRRVRAAARGWPHAELPVRPLARAHAARGPTQRRRRARALGETRRRRSFSRCAAAAGPAARFARGTRRLARLSRAASHRCWPISWAPSRRGRRDEHADREPAPDARDVLPADAEALQDPHRARRVPLGSLRRRSRNSAGTGSIRARRLLELGPRADGVRPRSRDATTRLLAEQGEQHRAGAPARRAVPDRRAARHRRDTQRRHSATAAASASISRMRSATCRSRCMTAAPTSPLVQLQVPERGPRRRRRLLRASAARALPRTYRRFAGWWGHDRERALLTGARVHAALGRGRLAAQQPADPVPRAARRIARAVRRSRREALAAQVARPDALPRVATRARARRSRAAADTDGSRPARLSSRGAVRAAAARPAVVARPACARPASSPIGGGRTCCAWRRCRSTTAFATSTAPCRRCAARSTHELETEPAHRHHRRRTRGQLARHPARAPGPASPSSSSAASPSRPARKAAARSTSRSRRAASRRCAARGSTTTSRSS